MRILIIYDSTQTYTQAVFDHLEAFSFHSSNDVYYCDIKAFSEELTTQEGGYTEFDAILIHYSVRLPFGGLNCKSIEWLDRFQGIKILFIQDEYDFTNLTKKIMSEINLDIVFTVVPERSVEKIYPEAVFPNVKFVSCLTGYVSDKHIQMQNFWRPLASREPIIGYRGRRLPLSYGALGTQKVAVGSKISDYCKINGIASDISCKEEMRIYGPKWLDFICSVRGMLGSESGSNVFDWDGNLDQEIGKEKVRNVLGYLWHLIYGDSEEWLYKKVVEPREVDGLMNQISPRIFETISCRTVLVLLEGEYSGILKKDIHYIPIRKDFSNLDEVFTKLNDVKLVEEMTRRAWEDVIISDRYSYKEFITSFDNHVSNQFLLKEKLVSNKKIMSNKFPCITDYPIKHDPPFPNDNGFFLRFRFFIYRVMVKSKTVVTLWRMIPLNLRRKIRKLIF